MSGRQLEGRLTRGKEGQTSVGRIKWKRKDDSKACFVKEDPK
jgi:hypothetical protein